jgi:branched-chain amino acid transport system permease protein
MSEYDFLCQQLITGFSNGAIIALIALGYTLVYGIIQLVNFAHGDLFMLGSFFALTLISLFAPNLLDGESASWGFIFFVFLSCGAFCGIVNYLVNRFAYRPIRHADRLSALVSALGVSFIFMNLGLFWGGANLPGFSNSAAMAAAPKDFPSLFALDNILGDSNIFLTQKEIFIFCITALVLALLVILVSYTNFGRAMRAVSEDPATAELMGINVEKVIALTFILGGILAGVASLAYASYNNTIHFQLGFRVGIDAFTAAVLGGIGNLPGAVIGGVLIGVIRALSDGYIASTWTNTIVFSLLIITLLIRPGGIMGKFKIEKV